MKFRPAAVPLITVDPFFSVWSCNDALYASPTEHWSGKPCPILAGVYIDNAFHSVAGFDPDGKLLKVVASRIVSRDKVLGRVGEVISADEEICVACGVGAVALLRVIPEGKGRMSAADFVRGRKIKTGDILASADNNNRHIASFR